MIPYDIFEKNCYMWQKKAENVVLTIFLLTHAGLVVHKYFYSETFRKKVNPILVECYFDFGLNVIISS